MKRRQDEQRLRNWRTGNRTQLDNEKEIKMVIEKYEACAIINKSKFPIFF